MQESVLEYHTWRYLDLKQLHQYLFDHSKRLFRRQTFFTDAPTYAPASMAHKQKNRAEHTDQTYPYIFHTLPPKYILCDQGIFKLPSTYPCRRS